MIATSPGGGVEVTEEGDIKYHTTGDTVGAKSGSTDDNNRGTTKAKSSSTDDWFSSLSINKTLLSFVDMPCGDLSAAMEFSESWGSLSRGRVLQLTEGDIKINYRSPLGSGAFCNVYPVYLKHPNTHEFTLGPVALKSLKTSVVSRDKTAAKHAIEDLRREAEILGDLAHSNVIDLYGVSNKNKVEDDKTFIVIEMLKGTLDSRLDIWSKGKGKFQKFAPADLVTVRLREVALGIVQGMQYLHSKNILFRDLKPDNIGFDGKDNVRLFDFGLALKLPSPDIKCKGLAGTVRYMAPECGGEFYGLSSDVYSFAILLWQIITTKLPFKHELSNFSDNVLPKDKRPALKHIQSENLQSLLEISWAARPDDRPTFAKIHREIRKIADSSIVMPLPHKQPVKKDQKKQRTIMLKSSLFFRG